MHSPSKYLGLLLYGISIVHSPNKTDYTDSFNDRSGMELTLKIKKMGFLKNGVIGT